MYLLQSSSETMPLIMFIGALVSLGILYLIIRAAVKDGTESLRTQIRFQNNLRIRELQQNGMSDEDITAAMSDALQGKVSDPKRTKKLS